MRVKKYTAPSMSEAMVRVKQDLGVHAVILHSRKRKTGGIFGFLSKTIVEVTAAHDPEPAGMKPQTAAKSIHSSNYPAMKLPTSSDRQEDSANMAISSPDPVSFWLKRLYKAGLGETETEKVKEKLFRIWYSSEEEPEAHALERAVKEAVSELLPPPVQAVKARYIQVFGPTGVGKTTTLAKLAAKTVLQDKKSAAFITADTYRIAAVEQLKTYAELLEIPVGVAYSAEDIQKFRDQFSDYDHVFIDTAGRNYRNKHYVNQLQDILGDDSDTERHLVLSATSKLEDMEAVVSQFSHALPDSLILTKLDETVSAGAAISIACSAGIPVSVMATGQNVPDDLQNAERSLLTERLLDWRNES
ncbi:AAA family ATPase [Alkalicoccus luteus]|uniref:Flagellar biosynthesis protein FlhF n=1 Tax=Alkalicoccus luteus TaxID=1237094 RepID=A0A969PLD6_9BACI|nr:flagellar biosynthesis protein FlhF [Alkalicoccus luteus]NJP36335.1 flagellar biosynthesis protein FlhF [Alkalicoccus luteus]